MKYLIAEADTVLDNSAKNVAQNNVIIVGQGTHLNKIEVTKARSQKNIAKKTTTKLIEVPQKEHQHE